jgi:Domain of unknown function (DUF4259)
VGTLGVEAFANDDALDWLLELDPADGVRPVLAALERAAGAIDPHLDAHTAAVALAAAELLAALRGRPHPALPEMAADWVAAVTLASPTGAAPDEEELALATRALDLVVTSSALAEIWSQRPDDAEWRSELDRLRLRLSL